MGYRPFVIVAFACAIGVGVFAAALTAAPTGMEADLLDLASNEGTVRQAAVDRLGASGGTVVTELMACIDNPLAPIVRAGIVQSIRKAGGPSSADATTSKQLLASNDVAIRYAAMVILIDNPALASAEIGAALANASESQLVRQAAASALGNSGPASRGVLSRVASGRDVPATVRKAAIRALAVCGPLGIKDVEAMANESKRDEIERHVAIRALDAAGPAGRAALTRLTASGTPFVRAHAVAGIGRAGSAEDAPTLVALCSDEIATVRLEALRALVALGLDGEQNAAVVACLADTDVRLQAEASQSLMRTKVAPLATAQERLRELIGSETFAVRYWATLSLHAYGDNHGLTQMDNDRSTGSLSQRKLATQAYGLLTGGN